MMSYKFNYFEIELHNHVASVFISRDQKSNALHEEAWEELRNIMNQASEDSKVRVVVLAGRGKHFSAGMDLETLMSLPSQWSDACEARKRRGVKSFIKKIQGCISSVESCRKPVIASVHGACIGGALSLVTACDFIYASRSAKFSLREAALGIVPDIGALQRMPLKAHFGRVAELAYTAANFDADEAMSMGMLNRVFENDDLLQSGSLDVAERIAGMSPLVIEGIKENLKYARSHNLEDSLDYVSVWNSAYLISDDLGKAMQAYVSKNKAEFRDL
mgnify:CR=1 FL=1|jgi:enoyl-CoA hydratase